MKLKNPHIALPLESFLQRLELAGFSVSPAQRMQLLRVLQIFGRDYLSDINQLKYRLCPIVARNEEEQKRFYELFDQYLEEIKPADWTPPEKEVEPHWYDQFPLWLWALLIPLFLALVVLLIPPDPPPAPIIKAEHPSEVQIGETVLFENKSVYYDSARVQFEWQLINEESAAVESSSRSKDWRLTIQDPGRSSSRQVLLIASDEQAAWRDTSASSFSIVCLKVGSIDAPEQADLDRTVAFRLAADTIADLRYFWDFGDGEQGLGREIEHRFRQSGTYSVRLRIERQLASGACVEELEHRVNIGLEKAFLAIANLEKDELNTLLSFSLGTWILLGILGVLIIYYWMKWLVSPPPETKEEKPGSAAPLSLGLPDKGPYFIPFRNRNGLIRLSPSMFRLANILRQRQEGFRKILDVPRSIQATMEEGGFPTLQLANTTVPSEYLFLIDEQAAGSHQSELYHYLFEFLRNKDVHVTAYRYDTVLNRFWNDATPEGISPDQLYRLYPNYRLMILGDARALIDPHSSTGPAVKKNYAEFIGSWKNSLLLTPTPLVSWNIQEAALYRLLPVFPGDIDGFQSAMAVLELALEEEEAPRAPFEQWRAQLSREHAQPDVNYRRWNRPETYKSYLKDHPQLYRWLCALAVYPDPNWTITIAIGRALEPLGVKVTFDNLLILSQIPWLSGDAFPPKLRFALLRELEEETERLARQASVKELNAVAHLVENSHAGLELQTNLAVQQFTLAPKDPERQEAIRELQAKGWLNNKQQAELNHALSQREDISQGNFEEYLAEAEKQAEDKPEKRDLAFNHYFYKALANSVLFVILWLVIWFLDGTNRFYDAVLPDSSRSISADSLHLLRDYFFVKENTYIDSAIIYNNAGVDAWQGIGLPEEENKKRITGEERGDAEKAIALFQKAYAYRRSSPYQLAEWNLGKARYNLGVLKLNHYLERFEPAGELVEARQSFNLAADVGAIRPDALHGTGLTHFYQQALDSAIVYRSELQDVGFFDTLSLYPNLQSLLGDTSLCAGPEIRFSIPENLCVGRSASLQNERAEAGDDVLYYLINWGDGSRDSVADFTTLSHRFSKAGDYRLNLRAFHRCPDGSLTQTQWNRALSVSQTARADFEVSATEGCAPLSVSFINRSTNSNSYEWDFGNKNISRSAEPPPFVFENPGQYTVRLRTQGACGQDEATRTIRVLPAADCEPAAALVKWSDQFELMISDRSNWVIEIDLEYRNQSRANKAVVEKTLSVALRTSAENIIGPLKQEEMTDGNRQAVSSQIQRTANGRLASDRIEIQKINLSWQGIFDLNKQQEVQQENVKLPEANDLPQQAISDLAALTENMPDAFYFDVGAPRRNYSASYDQMYRSYYAKKEEYLARWNGKEDFTQRSQLENFFERALKDNMEKYAAFRDQLIKYLDANQTLTIALSACLDTDAYFSYPNNISQNPAFDESLASRRIDSVVELFKQDKQLQGFIASNKLQFITDQRDCTTPQQPSEQKRPGKITTPSESIYSVEAALARRVELSF